MNAHVKYFKYKPCKKYSNTIFLISAIFLGSICGLSIPNMVAKFEGYSDTAILCLIFFIFLELPFENIFQVRKKIKFITIAWLTNFILIPTLGFLIAYALLHDKPAILLGLFIYFSFPCTDWFLAFTKLANGDTATGSVILPINMISQILLYPVLILIFANTYVDTQIDNLLNTLIDWFFEPFLIALFIHIITKKIFTSDNYKKINKSYNYIIKCLLAVLVFIIFAGNINTIAENIHWALMILVAVFIFFVSNYLITEKISKIFNFSYKLRVLYAMTTTARNAPLMLGITIKAIPDQPLVYMAIIIGMLVEFPHLTVLTRIFERSKMQIERIS